MQIIDYKPVQKGFLEATFTIKLTAFAGLIIRDMAYFIKGTSRWLAFPSKMYEKDGKKKYWAYVAFETPEADEVFKKQILSALDDHIRNARTVSPQPDDANVPF
jgi:hypothetical protein